MAMPAAEIEALIKAALPDAEVRSALDERMIEARRQLMGEV